MNLQESVKEVSLLREKMEQGLRALENSHRAMISCNPSRKLQTSVNLEAALEGLNMQMKRYKIKVL